MAQPDLPASIGPFRILRRLGAGGMAETFEGLREGPAGFTQRVCVKRVLPALDRDGELRRLFLREARLAAGLRHRAITQVVELGEDGGAHYLAMELVEGLDLRALLRRQPDGRLPRALAVLVIVELAAALEHAHARGVVHRDVSPANVLLGRDGDVKLTDFGIAKPVDAGLAVSAVVRGNPFYMAPERLESAAPARPSADVFSLGVVLFECLAGARPWSAPTAIAALRAAEAELPHRATLRTAMPELPEALHAVVDRTLAFDPSERPTAAQIVESLAPLVREAAARRTLRELVRGAPATHAAPVPERWRRYARAPRAWVDLAEATRLHDQRAAERPATEATTPALPARGSPSAWAALALVVVVLALLVLGTAASLLGG